MKVINDKKRLLFTLKEKTSGILVVAPEDLLLVAASQNQTTPVDPRPYKIYTALLTQSGTNDPVATVLENTLSGNIVWSYESTGIYLGVLNGAFPLNKTGVLMGNSGVDSLSLIKGYRSTINDIYIEASVSGVGTNGLLNYTLIEIRVYN